MDASESLCCPQQGTGPASTCTSSEGGECPKIDEAYHYPSVLYIMRHCDKVYGPTCPHAGESWANPDCQGGQYLGCSDVGEQRAEALPALFNKVLDRDTNPPAAIICARYDPEGCPGDKGSQRPCLLALPLAKFYKVPLYSWCKGSDSDSERGGDHAAAHAIRHTPGWADQPLIMVWDHSNISSPTQDTVLTYLKYQGPQTQWPKCDFSTILKVTWDSHGNPEINAYSDCCFPSDPKPFAWTSSSCTGSDCCLAQGGCDPTSE